MAEPTAEERLKIWAFRRALQALRQISPADLEWLSARLPSLGRATVVADAAAAVDGSAVPSQRTPFEAVIAFLQAATVHVTGRNMDALSGPALLIFGVLVGQRECLAFRDAHRRFEAAQRDAAAQPTAEADSAVEVAGSSSTAAAPVAPKLPSKPKLLLALAAMQLVEEPPGERKRVAPTDLDAEMLAEQAARQSRPKQQSAAAANTNNATAQPAKKAQPEKPAKAAAKKPAAKATASATTTAVAADAAEDSGDELVVAGGSSGVAVATRTSRGPAPTRAAPEAPVTADVASLAPKVARMVQLLTVTTPSVLVDKLRAQGIEASLADVNAAVQRLAQQELVVVEHGIIYPLC